MCQLQLLDELRNLKFSVASLADMVGKPGSYERENADNAKRGIKRRIDWIIEQLEHKLKPAPAPAPRAPVVPE